MTFLVFSTETGRYAIDVRQVVVVLPVPALRPLDLAPPAVAGVFTFRGDLVPVIDLSLVHGTRASRRSFGTRVMILKYPVRSGEYRPLGLIAEDVTDVIEVTPSSLKPVGVETPDAPWLGPIVADSRGSLLQTVHVEELLPEPMRNLLFNETGTDPS